MFQSFPEFPYRYTEETVLPIAVGFFQERGFDTVVEGALAQGINCYAQELAFNGVGVSPLAPYGDAQQFNASFSRGDGG